MIKLAVADFIIHFFSAGEKAPRAHFTGTYFPDYELVVILATERSQVLLVVREGQALDEHLVHLESVLHLERVKVPDDDVGLQRAWGKRSESGDLNSKWTDCSVL